MNRSKLAVLVGALCAVVFAFSMVSTAMATEDFQRWSVGTQIMYLDPDLDENINGLVSADDTMTGGLTVEYFFTPNFSTELVAAIAHVDIQLNDNKLSGGSAWLLPPSLHLKYHPIPNAKISPYVGLGVDWVLAWDEKINITGTDYSTHIDSSFGLAAKIGADIKVTENLYANIDIMYLHNETEIDISGVAMNQDLDIKIWSYNVGFKYRF